MDHDQHALRGSEGDAPLDPGCEVSLAFQVALSAARIPRCAGATGAMKRRIGQHQIEGAGCDGSRRAQEIAPNDLDPVGQLIEGDIGCGQVCQPFLSLEADAVPHLAKVEIAGPGFLNLFLAPTWLHDVLRDVVAAGDRYGRSTVLAGRRINLEFVSANPTGPLHAGGGRWVAVGDAIANLLAAQGAEVHREYYLNDAGAQLDKFRDSLYARYRGIEPPEDGYQGQYLVDMAAQLHAELGGDVTPEDASEWGHRLVVQSLKDDLARVGVQFDTWFSERTLHDRGEVSDVLAQLTAKGFVYERDGARWLRSSEFGDQRDRVLVRSDGSTTYLCNDLAYQRWFFIRNG